MLVKINDGSRGILTTPGEFFIRYTRSEPYYDFIILPAAAATGDDKIAVIEKDGEFFIEMDDDLVKKIKLYDDDDRARADLWLNDVFPYLKDDEIEVFLF